MLDWIGNLWWIIVCWRKKTLNSTAFMQKVFQINVQQSPYKFSTENYPTNLPRIATNYHKLSQSVQVVEMSNMVYTHTLTPFSLFVFIFFHAAFFECRVYYMYSLVVPHLYLFHFSPDQLIWSVFVSNIASLQIFAWVTRTRREKKSFRWMPLDTKKKQSINN